MELVDALIGGAYQIVQASRNNRSLLKPAVAAVVEFTSNLDLDHMLVDV